MYYNQRFQQGSHQQHEQWLRRQKLKQEAEKKAKDAKIVAAHKKNTPNIQYTGRILPNGNPEIVHPVASPRLAIADPANSSIGGTPTETICCEAFDVPYIDVDTNGNPATSVGQVLQQLVLLSNQPSSGGTAIQNHTQGGIDLLNYDASSSPNYLKQLTSSDWFDIQDVITPPSLVPEQIRFDINLTTLDDYLVNWLPTGITSDGSVTITPTAGGVQLSLPVLPVDTPDTWHLIGDTLDVTAPTVLNADFLNLDPFEQGVFIKDGSQVFIEGFIQLPTDFEVSATQQSVFYNITTLPPQYWPTKLVTRNIQLVNSNNPLVSTTAITIKCSITTVGVMILEYQSESTEFYVPTATGNRHKIALGMSYTIL